MHPPTLQLEAEYYPTENEFSVTTSASAVNEDEGISTYTLSRTSFYLVNHLWSSSNEDVATVDQNRNELVKEIDERGNETLYTYRKNSGRLKKIAYANGDYMKASYNMLGQMISEKWYDENDTLKYEYVYSYDNEGNVVRTIDSEREREHNYLYEDGNLRPLCILTKSIN